MVLGQFGGLSTITRGLARDLRLLGATVMPLDEPDAVAQAIAANHFAADVYLGFEGSADPVISAHYYKVPSFESVGGRSMAEAITDALSPLAADLGVPAQVVGMRLPVLRETRMPAVLVVIGPVRDVVDQSAMVTAAVQQALELWTSRAG